MKAKQSALTEGIINSLDQTGWVLQYCICPPDFNLPRPRRFARAQRRTLERLVWFALVSD